MTLQEIAKINKEIDFLQYRIEDEYWEDTEDQLNGLINSFSKNPMNEALVKELKGQLDALLMKYAKIENDIKRLNLMLLLDDDDIELIDRLTINPL
jgi:hypothetical protein